MFSCAEMSIAAPKLQFLNREGGQGQPSQSDCYSSHGRSQLPQVQWLVVPQSLQGMSTIGRVTALSQGVHVGLLKKTGRMQVQNCPREDWLKVK